MTPHSDHYTNKLYNLRQEPKKIRDPGVSLRTPGKISLGGPAHECLLHAVIRLGLWCLQRWSQVLFLFQSVGHFNASLQKVRDATSKNVWFLVQGYKCWQKFVLNHSSNFPLWLQAFPNRKIKFCFVNFIISFWRDTQRCARSSDLKSSGVYET